MENQLKKREKVELEIKESFQTELSAISQWKEKAFAIVVTSEDQLDLMAGAREARLQLVKKRTSAGKIKDALKEDALVYAKLVQSVYNSIVSELSEMEAHLKFQEEFVLRKEVERMNELSKKRREDSALVSEYIPANMDLGMLSEEAWLLMLNGAIAAKYSEEKRLAELEKQRIEDQKKEELLKEEQKKIREENERLQKQNAELQAKLTAIPTPKTMSNTIPGRVSDEELMAMLINELNSIKDNIPKFSDEKFKKKGAGANILLEKIVEYLKK